MDERSTAFLAQMQQLSTYVRNPECASPPVGVPQERAALYRSLFINNMAELLASTLSLTRKQATDAVWNYWVDRFYATHPHSTPYFMEIAGEFVEFLHSERAHHPQESLALRELAHFEWAQLALSVESKEADASIENVPIVDGDVIPMMQPSTVILAYEHPVQDLARLSAPEATILLLYRDDEDQVQRVLLSPLAARLLDMIQQGPPNPVHGWLALLAEGHPVTRRLQTWAIAFLEEMQLRGVLTAVRSINETS